MVETESSPQYLTFDDALDIEDDKERSFALACLSVGCLVQHEVSIADSVIDFLVINPQINNGGTLVEVTRMSKEDLDKKFIKKKKKGKKTKVLNTTGKRKKRQIEAMKSSGYRWTVMYGENLKKILTHS